MSLNFNNWLMGTFKRLRVVKTVAGAAGAATQTTVAGRVQIAAGQSSVVVTNVNCQASSTVLAVVSSADGAASTLKSVVPGNGSFTVTMSAAVTGATSVDYVILQST